MSNTPELDPEELEGLRSKAGADAVTKRAVNCAGLSLRPITMATYVILCGTGNMFFTKRRSSARAMFDAAAFVWLHSEPEDDVFSIDWQDPRVFSAAVTQWMNQFSGSQIIEFADTARTQRDIFMSREFQILGTQMAAEKKSKRGPKGR